MLFSPIKMRFLKEGAGMNVLMDFAVMLYKQRLEFYFEKSNFTFINQKRRI